MRISWFSMALCALAVLGLSSNVFAQEVKRKPKVRVHTKKRVPKKNRTKKTHAKKKQAKLPKVVVAPVPFQGMLGVMVGRLTPKKRVSLGAPPMAGIMVSKIVPGTIASVAGVKKGDVIIDVAGGTIRDVTDVRTALSQMNVGDLLTLQVIRSGKPLTLFSTLIPFATGNTIIKPKRFGDYPETGTGKRSLDGKIHFVSGDFVERRINTRMRKLKKRIHKLEKRRNKMRWRKKRQRK